MYRLKTSIGYVVAVDSKGNYDVGVKARAKVWKSFRGVEQAERLIRNLHSNTLSAGAMVVESFFGETTFTSGDMVPPVLKNCPLCGRSLSVGIDSVTSAQFTQCKNKKCNYDGINSDDL